VTDVSTPKQVAIVVAAPLVLAAAGLVHPLSLKTPTAAMWAHMHVLLLPVFPLLALGFVVPLWQRPRRGVTGVATVVAWLAAFTYACFYTGLDAVAGIAAGTAWRDAPAGVDQEKIVGPLYRMGDALGEFGVHAFLVAVVATCLALYQRAGALVLPGGIVLLVAGWSFVDSHIFRPRGVLTMLAIALGFALLTTASATGRRGRRRLTGPAVSPSSPRCDGGSSRCRCSRPGFSPPA
jgi:hypothetical protein